MLLQSEVINKLQVASTFRSFSIFGLFYCTINCVCVPSNALAISSTWASWWLFFWRLVNFVTCDSICREVKYAAITRITYETAVSGSILSLVSGDNGNNLAQLTEVLLQDFSTFYVFFMIALNSTQKFIFNPHWYFLLCTLSS